MKNFARIFTIDGKEYDQELIGSDQRLLFFVICKTITGTGLFLTDSGIFYPPTSILKVQYFNKSADIKIEIVEVC